LFWREKKKQRFCFIFQLVLTVVFQSALPKIGERHTSSTGLRVAGGWGDGTARTPGVECVHKFQWNGGLKQNILITTKMYPSWVFRFGLAPYMHFPYFTNLFSGGDIDYGVTKYERILSILSGQGKEIIDA